MKKKLSKYGKGFKAKFTKSENEDREQILKTEEKEATTSGSSSLLIEHNEYSNRSGGKTCSIEVVDIELEDTLGWREQEQGLQTRCSKCQYLEDIDPDIDSIHKSNNNTSVVFKLCRKCKKKADKKQKRHKTNSNLGNDGTSETDKDASCGSNTQEKRKSKKKKKSKSYRVWRACVTGWKYCKAGLVFYFNSSTSGLNPYNLAANSSNNWRNNTNSRMYDKYYYVYRT